MVHVLWTEAELKLEGGEEQANLSCLFATQGYGHIQAWAAAIGHIWVRGPNTARDYVDIHGPCYHQRSQGCPVSGLQTLAMLVSKGHCCQNHADLYCDPKALFCPGLSCGQGPYLGPWPYSSQGLLLTFMAHVGTKGHMEVWGLGHKVRNCLCLRAVLSQELCCSGGGGYASRAQGIIQA